MVVDAAARGTAGALPTLNVAAGLVTEPDFDASRWCELGGIACCRRGSSTSSFLARPHFGVAPAPAVRAELLSLRRSLRAGSRARSADEQDDSEEPHGASGRHESTVLNTIMDFDRRDLEARVCCQDRHMLAVWPRPALPSLRVLATRPPACPRRCASCSSSARRKLF